MAKRASDIAAGVDEVEPIKRPDPKLFTTERRKAITDAIMKGVPRDVAARAAGVSHQTFYNWVKWSPEFASEVEIADADAEKHAIETIQWAGRRDWKANAWWLERTRSETYALRTKSEVTGANGGPVEHRDVTDWATVTAKASALLDGFKPR
jgi:hypothetical protein